jgi:aryl-alcohol dehydrogenase-like predicted oxidoreductase
VLGDGEVLDALARLRDRGVRAGVTVSGVAQDRMIRAALDVQRGGGPLFDSVQATWNLLEGSCGDALREAHARGRTVLVKEALANGRLTPRGGASAEPLVAAARERGTPPDALALAAVLAQPFVDVVLSGAATVPALESNLRAAGLTVAPAALAELAEPSERYWSARSQLAWN